METTISNLSYARCVALAGEVTNDFYISPFDLNGNVIQQITLEVDAGYGKVNIYLPEIGLFKNTYSDFKLNITRLDISGQDYQDVRVWAWQSGIDFGGYNMIGDMTNMSLNDGGNAQLTIMNDIKWSALMTYSMPFIFKTQGNISQIAFSESPLVDLQAFSMITTQDYNGTGSACTLIKQNNPSANGSYEDWIVLATSNATNTGEIGSFPI